MWRPFLIDFEDFSSLRSLAEFIFVAAHIAADFWVKHSQLEQTSVFLKELTIYSVLFLGFRFSRLLVRFLLLFYMYLISK